LIRGGVSAVVAMRYEIGDDMAIVFADRFYRALFGDDARGRVDVAVQIARQGMRLGAREDAVRAFVTPVLHVIPGCEQVFDVSAALLAAAPAAPAEPLIAAGAGVQLPPEIKAAMATMQTVVVVGCRATQARDSRSDDRVATSRDLAERIARKYGYDDELKKGTRDVDDLDDADGFPLLQRICQVHVANPQHHAFELVQLIQKAYEATPPPRLLRLVARWRVPAYLYLGLDGLLDEALTQERIAFRPINGVDESPSGTDDVPLLVNVRGTCRDPDSLVLTEVENDSLWERLGAMSTSVQQLIRGKLGRNLLLVGACPRDPLVRRLVGKLLEHTTDKTTGAIYFACPKSEHQDPYWAGRRVVWIDAGPREAVEAISRLAGDLQ
jgi:hypothetical protein